MSWFECAFPLIPFSCYPGTMDFHSRIKQGSMDCFVNLRALRYKTANEPMVEAWQWSPLPICNASSLNHLSHSGGGLSHTMRNSNCPLDEDEKNRRLCDDWHCQLTIAVTQITEQCVDSFGFGYKRSQLWVPGSRMRRCIMTESENDEVRKMIEHRHTV